jgi:outer membrane protein assembly factor BamB
VNNKVVEWEQKLEAGYVCAAGMVADKKQNIYVIDNNASIYSFDLSGKMRWKQSLTKIDSSSIVTFSDLLAQEDGIVAASTDGIITKYSYNGKIIWNKKFNLPTTSYFASDKSGNLIIPLTHNRFGGNDSLISIDVKGRTNWTRQFNNTRIIKPPVIFEDRIYLCCVESSGDTKLPIVYVLEKKSGKIKKTFEINQTPRFISVDDDGNIYLVAYDGGFGKTISMIICWDKDGKKLWDKYFEVAIPYPIMISNKSLAFIGVDNEASGVYYLTKNGLVQHVISLTEAPTVIYNPTVAPGNKIVFGSTDRLGFVYVDDSPLNKFLPW